MTTHPQAEMTRERALEEALRTTANVLKRQANASAWYNDPLIYDTIRKVVEPAFATTRAPAPAADTDRLNLLERYVASIAMWMDRENVTDQERLSYIKGHPVTRAAARATSEKGGAG